MQQQDTKEPSLLEFAADLARAAAPTPHLAFPPIPRECPIVADLTRHAVDAIEGAVCDLVLAANEATSRVELADMRLKVQALVIHLQAVVTVTRDLSVLRFGERQES